ncbi:MAG: histidine phosphatase family protein [Acetobacteraceae bacterium]|nr:histidine phosphatase family protein [Acetobacteraceae bacterium]
MRRRIILALPLQALLALAAAPARAAAPPLLRGEEAEPRMRALQRGGFTLLLRHGDTRGMGCDRTTDWRDEAGQRHLSPAGEAQARAIGEVLRAWRIPIAAPVLASPVPRVRDTAVAAFGAGAVVLDQRLLSDEFTADVAATAAAQRALLAEDPPPGLNRMLVGHIASALQVGGRRITQAEFPEGAILVLRGGAMQAVLDLAPLPGGGAHGCGWNGPPGTEPPSPR